MSIHWRQVVQSQKVHKGHGNWRERERGWGREGEGGEERREGGEGGRGWGREGEGGEERREGGREGGGEGREGEGGEERREGGEGERK